MTRRTPAAGWVLLPALLLLGGCVGTAPASAPAVTESAPAPVVGATPTPKYQYTAREQVTGVYIFTEPQPTLDSDGWAIFPPTDTAPAWYAHGPATDTLTVTTREPITKLVWVLPDGSQRVQEGDLTYYNPETGTYE